MKPEEQIITADPDIIIKTITPEMNFIILGCDGIWEKKNENEIGEIIRTKLEVEGNEIDTSIEYLLD